MHCLQLSLPSIRSHRTRRRRHASHAMNCLRLCLRIRCFFRTWTCALLLEEDAELNDVDTVSETMIARKSRTSAVVCARPYIAPSESPVYRQPAG